VSTALTYVHHLDRWSEVQADKLPVLTRFSLRNEPLPGIAGPNSACPYEADRHSLKLPPKSAQREGPSCNSRGSGHPLTRAREAFRAIGDSRNHHRQVRKRGRDAMLYPGPAMLPSALESLKHWK